jgi:hypothetical protein
MQSYELRTTNYLLNTSDERQATCDEFAPFCTFLWLKNPRNLRLINDLRSTKVYVRKNKLFMQNKANFKKVKLNVSPVNTKNYDQMDTWSIRITKPITISEERNAAYED